MTSPQTAPPRTNGHHPIDISAQPGRHPLAGLAAAPTRSTGRAFARPPRVRYARSWLGLGAGTALLGLLGLWRYGRPALAGMGALGMASAAYMALFEPARPTLERVTLRLPGLPLELDGLCVGQIS